ncbi:uncharacterized protein SCHCODRAFT_01170474 [Schizophyllum commune H4-8]|uniref:Uncharacterized protein n=1 Tax=Schizophyllum commune (strain H4-8 / FGSC 9210) TaxID=578458 RepID=D8PZD3_SCHCM|nr:uncharacterized protein SCHCODRAFT_01170474 [Schizophyllum commune H4-8]KAI5896320.1 hypothetical protein SCHCODRAFT_01170474 [Schizophyllum commune H4-8]
MRSSPPPETQVQERAATTPITSISMSTTISRKKPRRNVDAIQSMAESMNNVAASLQPETPKNKRKVIELLKYDILGEDTPSRTKRARAKFTIMWDTEATRILPVYNPSTPLEALLHVCVRCSPTNPVQKYRQLFPNTDCFGHTEAAVQLKVKEQGKECVGVDPELATYASGMSMKQLIEPALPSEDARVHRPWHGGLQSSARNKGCSRAHQRDENPRSTCSALFFALSTSDRRHDAAALGSQMLHYVTTCDRIVFRGVSENVFRAHNQALHGMHIP